MKIQSSSTSKKADEQEISIAIKKLDADKPINPKACLPNSQGIERYFRKLPLPKN